MRIHVTALCGLWLCGCGSERPNPTSPPTVEETGNFRAVIQVTGDVNAGPPQYLLRLDGQDWKSVSPLRDNLLKVGFGFHTVTMKSIINPLSVSWCSLVGTNVYSGEFSESLTTATFLVDCPRMDSTGVIVFTVTATGKNLPQALPLMVERINGAPRSQVLFLPPNEAVSVTLDEGLYEITQQATGTCSPPNTLNIFGPARRAVKASRPGTYSGTYVCS